MEAYMLKRLKSDMRKLPVLLLMGALISIAFAGVSQADMYWTDNAGTRFASETLKLANGEQRDIVLRADVPAGQHLKAFTFTIGYGTNIRIAAIDTDYDFSVTPNPSVFPDGSGTLKVSGFDAQGVQGGAGVKATFLKLTIEGIAEASAAITIPTIDAYGTDAATQFPPATVPLTVTVGITQADNEIYWTDTSNIKLDEVPLVVGQQMTIRLRAGVATGTALGAFNFTLTYNPSVISVGTITPTTNDWNTNINTLTPGTIIVNGFYKVNAGNNVGIAGPAIVSFFDVPVTALAAGSSAFSILVNSFGASAGDLEDVKPTPDLNFIIRSLDKPQTYWADTSNNKLPAQVDLTSGAIQTIRLMATVPPQTVRDNFKTLNAYKFTLTYDNTLVDILEVNKVSGSAFPPNNINNDTANSRIIVNGYDVQGVSGPAIIAIVDVKVQAKNLTGSFNFLIHTDNYGSSSGDEFLPVDSSITMTVSAPTHQVYWVDPGTGARVTALTIQQGSSATVRLMTGIPANRNLSAYKFTIGYGAAQATVSVVRTPGSLFPPTNINTNTPGTIVINGFAQDGVGVPGGAGVAVGLIDVTIQGLGSGIFPLSILVDSFGASAIDQFPPTPVPATITIQGSVVPPPVLTYSVTFVADEGGTIENAAADGKLTQVVPEFGATTPVKAIPKAGYKFVNWTGTGGFVSTDNPVTITNVTQNMEIKANFKKGFSVIFKAGANGTLSGETTQVVDAGGTTSPVEAIPASGYVLVNWTGTGGFSSTENPLTVTNVQSDMEITANFGKSGVMYYTVKFFADENGMLEYLNERKQEFVQVVEAGTNTSPVKAVPNNGFKFLKWVDKITGLDYSIDNPLTILGVVKNMELTARFEALPSGDTFTVEFTTGSGGSLAGSLTQIVNKGGSTTPVTASAIQGYRFVNWTGTGGFVTSTANPLTVANVQSNMVITANFEVIPLVYYTVTFEGQPNGQLSGDTTQTVIAGGSTSQVLGIPDSGYRFMKWTSPGDQFPSTANPLVVTNVMSDMTIKGHFTGIGQSNSPDPIPVGDGPLNPILKVMKNYYDPTGAKLKITGWQLATGPNLTDIVFEVGNPENLYELPVLDFFLEPGTQYCWKAKFVNENGVESDWSIIDCFITRSDDPDDKNQNGIPDKQEITDPTVDMNGNKVPDKNEIGPSFLAVKRGDGGTVGVEKASDNIQALRNLEWIDLTGFVSKPPSDLEFPTGMITYKLETAKVGDTVKVKLYYSGIIPANVLLYKYDQIKGWYQYTHAVISGNTILLTLTDGGQGDADGVANGVIIDPFGLALKKVPAPPAEEGSDNCFITTAADASKSGFALIFMAIAAAAAILSLRRGEK
jgi:uncharacterized repeat protein (TIGR02543 family)